MSLRECGRFVAVTAAFAALTMFGAGCGGPNPPCETDIAAVDAARKAASDAEARLAELESRQQALEEQIAAEETRRDELEQRKVELEAKGAEISK